MKLIVNADDFGLSRGVNFGIVDAMHHGIVRSTTLMASGPAFDHAVELGKRNEALGIGIHLTLTWGYPLVSGHKTLVDEQGRFHKLAYVESHPDCLDPAEIQIEFTAQIEKVLASGIRPTHLDSHHHVHMLPAHRQIIAAAARTYSLPYRGMGSFTDAFYGTELTAGRLLEMLEAYRGEGPLEVMCHPGYLDPGLQKESSYNLPRVQEYAILTAPETLAYIKEKKIELINYTVNT